MGFALKASAGGGTEAVPPGNHPARLVAIIDLGTHDNEYQGQVKGKVRQIYLCFELVSEQVAGTKGVNHLIGGSFNFVFSSKASLRKFVESWGGKSIPDGTDFDLDVLLGKPCLLAVSQQAKNDRNYSKIDAATPVPKGFQVPPSQHVAVSWQIGDGGSVLKDGKLVKDSSLPGGALPEALSWLPYSYGSPLKDIVNDSDERKGLHASTPSHGTNGQGQQPAGNGQVTQTVGAGVGADFEEIPF